jgi:hypothetical protein
MAGFNPRRAPVNGTIRTAAQKLLDRDRAQLTSHIRLATLFDGSGPHSAEARRSDELRLRSADRAQLEKIVYGKLKSVDVEWWRALHSNVGDERAPLIAAMADPSRNPNENERKVAAAKLISLKAKGAPGLEAFAAELAAYEASIERVPARPAIPVGKLRSLLQPRIERLTRLGQLSRDGGNPPEVLVEASKIQDAIDELLESRLWSRLGVVVSTDERLIPVESVRVALAPIVAALKVEGKKERNVASKHQVRKQSDLLQSLLNVWAEEGYVDVLTVMQSKRADSLHRRHEREVAAFEAAIKQSPFRHWDTQPREASATRSGTDNATRSDTQPPRWAARNATRAAERAKARASLRCQQCGKPLDAQRPTMRYCGPTCRSNAFRGKPPTAELGSSRKVT